jgi:predicted nucleic acid-binding protein
MIVVADTSPLNYLVLIGAQDVLEALYESVVVPLSVCAELIDPETPAVVREWICQPPVWLKIVPDPAQDGSLDTLDPGERAAIALALSLPVNRVLIDEARGRKEAERRNLKVTGTVGVLAAAHQNGPLDFDTAIARLCNTSFYVSSQLLATARRLLYSK